MEQTPHLGEEPHVRHSVGLVHYHRLNLVEPHPTPFDQICKSSRAGDENVHSPVQLPALLLVGDPAVNGADPALSCLGQRRKVVADLLGELAVGARTSARGRPGLALGTVAMIGIPKARVLPEPVGRGHRRHPAG